MVLHPTGDVLVVESRGCIVLVDLLKMKVISTLLVPATSGPSRELLEHAASQITDEFLSLIKESMPQLDAQQYRRQIAEAALPKQSVRSLSFGESGSYLFCGTNEGVCALEWGKALALSGLVPIAPLGFVKAEPLTPKDGIGQSQLVYAVVVDSKARRILFAGLEGKVRFINFSDGSVGDLLDPGIRRPFSKLELTPDRSSLVGTAHPKRESSRKIEPASFQIWNYPALCKAAGLEW